MPVVPYSGGTSLEGHYTSPFAGISLDMSQMDKIIAVHAEDGDMVVQSGAKWEDINDHLAKLGHSLFFPLDPGPGATIGGMISTGCSGTNAVRYGTARGEHFLNMTIVLPNGDVIKTRQRARKSSAGFNVGSIVVGAEGTLGVVTEATIRLTPKLPSAVAIASFPNVEQASKAVGEILLKGVPVQCIELLDAAMMSAINDSGLCPRTYPVKDTLFFKLSGGEGAIAEARSIIKEAAKKFGSDPASFEYERDEEKANMIWQGRKYALWSVKALDTRESSRVWTTDVCVPLSALPRLVRETQADLQATGLKNAIVGHAGDGNFHGFLIFDSDSDEEVEKATKAVERMCERAQAMEGTCTGEHGIGTGKVRFLKNELGEGTLRLMKAVKLMFDPLNIMNPGKLYPLDDEEAGRN
ncbi:hypothetical protein IE53DRAFT_385212 [Violaceomyces palustris]|uniref:Uncharacterized protein n=1 Tax=Violaceomyces palustris TaxID=1673888 RepID=A0ACD0P327_9BASI|nr:hypothetical protein IE53DRAFT_385212 [Violaceomyces palustris]